MRKPPRSVTRSPVDPFLQMLLDRARPGPVRLEYEYVEALRRAHAIGEQIAAQHGEDCTCAWCYDMQALQWFLNHGKCLIGNELPRDATRGEVAMSYRPAEE